MRESLGKIFYRFTIEKAPGSLGLQHRIFWSTMIGHIKDTKLFDYEMEFHIMFEMG